jgi:hypothetical protein
LRLSLNLFAQGCGSFRVSALWGWHPAIAGITGNGCEVRPSELPPIAATAFHRFICWRQPI